MHLPFLRLAWVMLGVGGFLTDHASAQVTLRADGPGSTYELINSVLGGSAEEVPDCADPAFGRHITEDWDATLGEYVFIFHIHVTPDNDRCVNFDRQRNEIKTYGPSPAYLKGFYGDTCSFRWKFRLDDAFQSSPNFCHIHQIKAGDGSDSGSPLITITPRYGSPEKLELIYTAPTGLSGSGTKTNANLSSFKGQWIEAYERVVYATNGSYELTLRRFSDGAVLLAYTNNNLNLWRGDATFNRPKWGIYRSLNSSNYLRDEQVRFADFCIAKGGDVCPSSIGTQTRFTLSPTPSAAFVLRGDATNLTVTVSTNVGFTAPVVFSANGLPANTAAHFTPPSLSAAGTAQLTITTSNNTPAGTFPFAIAGTAPNFTNTAIVTLTISTNDLIASGKLVARFTFDDGTADDSSGYDNNGILHSGAMATNDPQRGRVVSLDGTNGYVDLGNDSSLDLSTANQATVAAWIKISLSHNHNTILSKGEWKDAYSLVVKGDTTPQDQLWTGNDTSVFSGSPIPTNVWTHVAVSISNNLTTFFINGQVAGAANQNRGNAIDGTTNDVCLGREQYSGSLPSGRWFFNGFMDDVRIYSQALTAAEIQSIVAETAPTPPRITGFALDGAAVVINGSYDFPGAACCLLTSTNVLQPVANWTRVATNAVETAGHFSITNIVAPGLPARFYRVQAGL